MYYIAVVVCEFHMVRRTQVAGDPAKANPPPTRLMAAYMYSKTHAKDKSGNSVTVRLEKLLVMLLVKEGLYKVTLGLLKQLSDRDYVLSVKGSYYYA